MPVRSPLRSSSLRLGAALLGATLVIVACSGAADRSADSGAPAPGTTGAAPGAFGQSQASPGPSVDWVELLSPDPSPAASSEPSLSPAATPSPAGPQSTNPGSTAISTTKAAGFLSQVNHLLTELNGELSSADAAANNPGE